MVVVAVVVAFFRVCCRSGNRVGIETCDMFKITRALNSVFNCVAFTCGVCTAVGVVFSFVVRILVVNLGQNKLSVY